LIFSNKLGFLNSLYYTIQVSKKESAKRKALERQADKMLERDAEAQKLKEKGKTVDVNKFKKLL